MASQCPSFSNNRWSYDSRRSGVESALVLRPSTVHDMTPLYNSSSSSSQGRQSTRQPGPSSASGIRGAWNNLKTPVGPPRPELPAMMKPTSAADNKRPSVVGLDPDTILPATGCGGRPAAQTQNGFSAYSILRSGPQPPPRVTVVGDGKTGPNRHGKKQKLAAKAQKPPARSRLSLDCERMSISDRVSAGSSTSTRCDSDSQVSAGGRSTDPRVVQGPSPHTARNHRLASRHNPWVGRYKIKRNMNDIHRIFASQHLPDSQYSGAHAVFS